MRTEDVYTKNRAASNVFFSRTWDCYIWPTYLLQEELGALVVTEDRHGNVSMQWRFITLTETFGGMDLLCLLPSSPYEQTLPAQAPWKGSSTSVEDFAEQVLKWVWRSLCSWNQLHCTQTDLMTDQPYQVALACPGTTDLIQPFGLLAPNVNKNCVLFALCFFP